MVFQIAENVLGSLELVLHVLAVTDLSDPFEHNFFVHVESILDQINVVLFTLNNDLALMGNTIVPDNKRVPLSKNLEGSSLRDNNRVCDNTAEQHGAGLTVP